MGPNFKTTWSLIIPPTPSPAASLRLQALLGKSWGCLCIKATCAIGPDSPGTLVPRLCDKHSGKAQDQILQVAERQRGWTLFISQDVLSPRDSYWHGEFWWGSCPPPGPSCQHSPSITGRQDWASQKAKYPVLFIYLKAAEAVTEPWPHRATSHTSLGTGVLSPARYPRSSPPSPLPHHLLAS